MKGIEVRHPDFCPKRKFKGLVYRGVTPQYVFYTCGETNTECNSDKVFPKDCPLLTFGDKRVFPVLNPRDCKFRKLYPWGSECENISGIRRMPDPSVYFSAGSIDFPCPFDDKFRDECPLEEY